jgi:uncharacterized protein (DUF2336 family)
MELYNQLLHLAAERNSEARRELLGKVADLFIAKAAEQSAACLTLFGEVLGRLVAEADVEARSDLSTRVAASPLTPIDLVGMLANDRELAVAEPMLRQSPVLTDAALLDVIRHQGQGHLKAIAQRRAVATAVTDALVVKGDREVLWTVVLNPGAAMSEGARNTIVERSDADVEIVTALLERTDLPPGFRKALLEQVPGDVRAQLAHLAQFDPDRAAQLLRTASTEASNAPPPSSKLAVRALVKAIRSGDRTADDVVDELIDKEDLASLTALFSVLAEIPEEEVRAALSRVQMTGSVVICRHLGISRRTFAKLAYWIATTMRLPETHAKHFIAEYDGFDKETVGRVLRFLSVRRSVGSIDS